MNGPTLVRISVFACAVLAAVIALLAGTDEPYDRVATMHMRATGAELQDRPAIPFTLSDLDGRPVSLSDFAGDVVFLNFWASWCPPCVEEFPAMITLTEQIGDRPFTMIAVTQDEDPEALAAFLRQVNLPNGRIVLLQDPTGELAQQYGTVRLPETYIIDPRGLVVARYQGARNWLDLPHRQLLERLMRHPWRAEG
ncbi:MAG: cytochrome c biogenesis protein CcmG/thiol:disulfide interchange protein DsbE [Bradymonadia bacterium]|jgi:cytochrome c biogenesis protein CcmG/thiol:disulfide interchange protein DsbE